MPIHFPVFSRNGQILPIDQAVVPIANLEYSYGFGVYETLKVRKGNLYFLPEHIERLFHSALLIGLEHKYSHEDVRRYLREIVSVIGSVDCNLKVLFIGASQPENTQIYIIPLAPLFPDRKLYKHGAKLVTVEYERWMPQAKSLNMLGSYVMYTKAKKMDCYDALLINRDGNMTEGTRTNMYVMKGKTIISPPKELVLEGVTMRSIEKIVTKNGFEIRYQHIPRNTLTEYDGMFLSSTSSKIIPVQQVDDQILAIPEQLRSLMKIYDQALDASQGDFEKL